MSEIVEMLENLIETRAHESMAQSGARGAAPLEAAKWVQRDRLVRMLTRLLDEEEKRS